jgi:hypothetical protein
LFTSPPVEWVNSQVSIVRGEAAGELASVVVSMTPGDLDSQLAGDQIEISGSLANSSSAVALASLTVIATTYSSEGYVTGFRQRVVVPETPVAPGASIPFSIRLSYHGQAPANFSVLALGRGLGG